MSDERPTGQVRMMRRLFRWVPPRGSFERKVLFGGLAAGVGGALLVGAWLVGSLVWEWMYFERALAPLRAAGQPVSAEDLATLHRVPEGVEDSTEHWMAALAPLRDFRPSTDYRELPFVGRPQEAPLPGQPWQDREQAEALLNESGDVLEGLYEAAGQGGAARYPLDFSQGAMMELSHWEPLGWAYRLLRLDARVAAHRGDARRAAKAIRAILATARTLQYEPMVASQLRRVRDENEAHRELQVLLPRLDVPEDELRRIQQQLRAGKYKESLHRALLGEQVFDIMNFKNPPPPDAFFTIEETNTMDQWQRWADVERFQELMPQVIDAAKQPWPKALHRAKDISKEAEALDGRYLISGRLRYVRRHFTSIAQGVARNRAADAAIAVQLYERRHGERPEQLENLVPEFLPEVPLDPFDGEPLRYVQDADGYAVYSVGDNGVDDGGVEAKRVRGDVVFGVTSAAY